MTKNKLYTTALVAALAFGTISCKDQLDIGNPNLPSAIPGSEAAILQLATGGVFINGFSNGDAWLGNSYFSLPMGYNELLADNVGASASNNQVTTIAQPEYIQFQDGTKRTNPSPTTGIIRTYNTRASTGGGNNALHYQWLNMYAMNNAMNLVLSYVEDIPYAIDGPDKIKVIKAWSYFWKGFAYSSIGTKYIAGLIINEAGETSSTYVTHDAMIVEANKWLDLAATTLDGIADPSVYDNIIATLIPKVNHAGRGGSPDDVLSAAEWKRTISTLKARNLVANKLARYVNGTLGGNITGSSMSASMSAADWATVLALTADGVGVGPNDKIFAGFTNGSNDFFTATGGTVASLTANPAKTSTFKTSERAIQAFKTGDRRLTRNFSTAAADQYSNDYVYGTRYTLLDHDQVGSEPAGVAGAFIYANKGVGAHELVIVTSWEENALLRAEALIRGGAPNVDAAVALINSVRTYMGAGVTALPTGLTPAAAMAELAMEKRASLLYRGLSFYDLRRWGQTYDVANGGGFYGATVVIGAQVNTNVIINYDFMDYWDVPANEIVLNPADGSSAPTVNPNFN